MTAQEIGKRAFQLFVVACVFGATLELLQEFGLITSYSGVSSIAWIVIIAVCFKLVRMMETGGF